MKNFIITIVLVTILCSCRSTKYIEVPVEVEKIKTEYIVDHRVDSIYEKDSINIYSKSDTIFIYKQKVQNKFIYKTDTVIKTDSIPYLVETKTVTTKEVNILKWYQKILMYLGIFALGIGVLLLYKKFN